MFTQFKEFNAKIKFIMKADNDWEVADDLGIKYSTYQTMKRLDNIPYEQVIEYCKDKQVDLNWILTIKCR